MKKICIATLLVIMLFLGCTNGVVNQTQNPSQSHMTTDETVSSAGGNTISTTPGETYTGTEQWQPESGDVYDISSLIVLYDQFRLDRLIPEKNIMLYKDTLGDNVMVVPYECRTHKLETEKIYTFPAGIYAETHISNDVIYTTERDFKSWEWVVRTYTLLDGKLVNTLVTKDSLGYTSVENSILLFCTEENQQRVYLKSLIDGHEDTVLTWDTSDKFAKPIISDIVQGENGFSFVGNIFTSVSDQSVLCCGFIDLQGNLIELNMYNDEHRVIICNGGILVQDDIPGFGSQYDPEGKYYFYDLETLSIKKIDAQDPKCRIFISDNGKTLIAVRVEEDVCCIWTYDLCRGECSNKISYKMADIQVSQYNILFSKNEDGFYLFLKGNSKAKLIYFGI